MHGDEQPEIHLLAFRENFLQTLERREIIDERHKALVRQLLADADSQRVERVE